MRRRTKAWLGRRRRRPARGLYASNGYLRAAAFVVQAAGMQGFARSAARLEINAFDERALTIPWRGGELRGRLYTPRGASDRAMLLVPGVHAAGVDEPRLVQFARDLAAVRHTVLTAELADLTQYRITPSNDRHDRGRGAVAVAAERARAGRARRDDGHQLRGRPVDRRGRRVRRIRDRVAFVMSFGGHGDLPRTLRYLCTGIQADGAHRPPHDYGVVIILLSVAERVVPPDQVAPLARRRS